MPPAPTVHEQRAVMLDHFDMAEQLYGAERCGIVMRKFGIKYAALHPDFQSVRADLVKVRDRDSWMAAISRWYEEDRPGMFPPVELHKAQGEG